MIGKNLINLIKENNLENEEFRICNDFLLFELKTEGKSGIAFAIDEHGCTEYDPRTGQVMLVDPDNMKEIEKAVNRHFIEEMLKEMTNHPYRY